MGTRKESPCSPSSFPSSRGEKKICLCCACLGCGVRVCLFLGRAGLFFLRPGCVSVTSSDHRQTERTRTLGSGKIFWTEGKPTRTLRWCFPFFSSSSTMHMQERNKQKERWLRGLRKRKSSFSLAVFPPHSSASLLPSFLFLRSRD